MSDAEVKTLQTFFQVERTQLLTILAMSVKNPQLAGFLLPKIVVISCTLKVLLPGFKIVLPSLSSIHG